MADKSARDVKKRRTRGGGGGVAKKGGKQVANRPLRCSHWTVLMKSMRALDDTMVRVHGDSALSGTMSKYMAHNTEKTSRTHRVDCHRCYCITCDFSTCLYSQDADGQNHFYESGGHLLGYCWKYDRCLSVFCFKCDTLIDVFVEVGSGPCKITLPLEITKRKVKPNKVKPFVRRLPKELETTLIQRTHPTIYCRGLYNFDKTCYLNCIIQVLIHTPLISNFFAENEQLLLDSHKKRDKQGRQREKEMSIVSVFHSLVLEFQERDAAPIVPSQLLIYIWENHPEIGSNKQHDAHEFFITVINLLHREFIKPNGTNVINRSLIDRVFHGRLQSEVTCSECRLSRYTDDPFLDASLEVISDKPHGVPIELCDLLRRFTRVEHLDDLNLLHCPFCAKKTRSTKQLSFKELPEIICLQLKRFKHTQRGPSDFMKIKTKVHIPDLIDFSPYRSNPSDEAIRPHLDTVESGPLIAKNIDVYHLYAIISHSGSYASGHYRAYIMKSSFWFVFDDETVRQVPQEEAIEKEGYLLFYKKGHPLSVQDHPF